MSGWQVLGFDSDSGVVADWPFEAVKVLPEDEIVGGVHGVNGGV